MYANNFLVVSFVDLILLFFIQNLGRRKVHYTFPDDVEMVEEYETTSGELLGKWKKLTHQ